MGSIMVRNLCPRLLLVVSMSIGGVLIAVGGVKAQNPTLQSRLAFDNEIDRALATKHSQGTIAAMAEALAASAEPACRVQRKLSDSDFKRHAKEILRHYGRQWIALAAKHPNMQAIVRSTFGAAGDQVHLAAFNRLLQHPKIVASIKAERSHNDVTLVDQLVSGFLRYTRTVKLSIKDFSFLGTGQDRMAELRTKIEEEAERASQSARPQWEELLQLLEPHLPIIQAKQQEVAAALVDDYKVFAGVEGRLQELCISVRS
jgi:hypothetical protein